MTFIMVAIYSCCHVSCTDFTETFHDTIAMKGSRVSLNCNISVPDNVQCKWKHDGKDISDSNNMSLELFNVGSNNEGSYTCMIMRNDQELFASTAKLEVLGKFHLKLATYIAISQYFIHIYFRC